VLVVYGINSAYDDPHRQGLIFILFGSSVALGAIYSWAYLPDPQRWYFNEDGKRRLEQKTLEDLGGGREKAKQQGEVIGIRNKWRDIKQRRRRHTPSPGPEQQEMTGP
jgi:PHS family inorganic phosphate transporter-like MFS transporter